MLVPGWPVPWAHPVTSAISNFPICHKVGGLDSAEEAQPTLTPGFLAGGGVCYSRDLEGTGSQAAWEHSINSNCKFPPGSISKPQGLPGHQLPSDR